MATAPSNEPQSREDDPNKELLKMLHGVGAKMQPVSTQLDNARGGWERKADITKIDPASIDELILELTNLRESAIRGRWGTEEVYEGYRSRIEAVMTDPVGVQIEKARAAFRAFDGDLGQYCSTSDILPENEVYAVVTETTHYPSVKHIDDDGYDENKICSFDIEHLSRDGEAWKTIGKSELTITANEQGTPQIEFSGDELHEEYEKRIMERFSMHCERIQ